MMIIFDIVLKIVYINSITGDQNMKTKTFSTGSKWIKIFKMMGWRFWWSDQNSTTLWKGSK